LEFVGHHGRVQEKSRFRKGLSLGPRARALAALSPDDPEGIWAPEPDLDDDRAVWTLDPSFEEIPVGQLAAQTWTVLFAEEWQYEMAVHMGEARACVLSAGWVAGRAAHCRQLLLGDNLGVTLAMARKRAKAFPLLLQVRRLSAISLARDIDFSLRWVPSEFNIADLPSRNYCLQFGQQVQLLKQNGILIPVASALQDIDDIVNVTFDLAVRS